MTFAVEALWQTVRRVIIVCSSASPTGRQHGCEAKTHEKQFIEHLIENFPPSNCTINLLKWSFRLKKRRDLALVYFLIFNLLYLASPAGQWERRTQRYLVSWQQNKYIFSCIVSMNVAKLLNRPPTITKVAYQEVHYGGEQRSRQKSCSNDAQHR